MRKQMRGKVRIIKAPGDHGMYLSKGKKMSCAKKDNVHAQTNAGKVHVVKAPAHHGIWAKEKDKCKKIFMRMRKQM